MSAVGTPLGEAPRAAVVVPPRVGRLVPHAVMMLGLLAVLIVASSKLLNDPDSLWHVVVGAWIWTHGTVPTTDLYSYTYAGAPWIAKEWLSQLIFFAAHQAAGWWGVVMVAALAIASAFTLLHAWLRQRVRASVALAATLVAIILAEPHFLARPHALVMPVIVLWMVTIVGALDRREAPPLLLVPLMALWANMHGSFPLGLVMAGVLAAEGVLFRPKEERLASARRWALFLVAALAATIVSPYGWNAILVPLQMSSNAATLRYINEWQPLRLDFIGICALSLLAAIVAMLAAGGRANLFRIVAALLLAYLMIRHQRFISLFGIIAPILAARAIAQRVGPAEHQEARPALLGLAAGLGLACVVLGAWVRPMPDPTVAPDAAFRFAMAKGVTGPVYNDYDFGGYLIAHGVKTFVDGRTDQLFLGDFLPDLARAIESKTDDAFAATVTHHHAHWALVRTGSKDAAHFSAMPGWSRIYQDSVADVFVASP